MIIATGLLAVSLFFPAFEIDQEMRSNENPARYAQQTDGFRPWGYNTGIETTILNETGSVNSSEVYEQSSMSAYSQSSLYFLPIISTTLMLFAMAGSLFISILLVLHDPGNRKKSLFTYMLFFPVVFSCILLAAVFFFLIPRVAYKEVDLPRTYEAEMPFPSIGTIEGDVDLQGYGSAMFHTKAMDDPDSFSYKLNWHPGPALYIYISAFIFSIFGSVFYNKMRRMKGYERSVKKMEEDQEGEPLVAEAGDDEVVVLEAGMDLDEPEEVFAASDGSDKVIVALDVEYGEEVEAEEVIVEEEEGDTGAETTGAGHTAGAADAGAGHTAGAGVAAGTAASRDKMKPRGRDPPQTPEPRKPQPREPPDAEIIRFPRSLSSSAGGPVMVIEFGEKDFDKGAAVEEEELTIEGVKEATLECPGCSRRFRAPLDESIRCPHCGLEGGTDR